MKKKISMGVCFICGAITVVVIFFVGFILFRYLYLFLNMCPEHGPGQRLGVEVSQLKSKFPTMNSDWLKEIEYEKEKTVKESDIIEGYEVTNLLQHDPTFIEGYQVTNQLQNDSTWWVIWTKPANPKSWPNPGKKEKVFVYALLPNGTKYQTEWSKDKTKDGNFSMSHKVIKICNDEAKSVERVGCEAGPPQKPKEDEGKY
jgi:hypothetical protein